MEGKGAKYANGNYKNQQKAYNRTKKGKALRVNANRLRKQLGLKKGDSRDAAHYKGSTTEGRPQSKHLNRRSRLKRKRK
jgi:hypothetical protein